MDKQHWLPMSIIIGLILSINGWHVDAAPIDALPAVQAGCESASADFATGLSEGEIESAGETRHYLLYLPESLNPVQAASLVISLHGFASSPRQQAEFSQWNRAADAYGFIVVYPQGTGFPLRWNVSGLSDAPDDVRFIQDLIDHLSTDVCIDLGRIYVSGFSNGGGMADRIACELADEIAAIGTVAGANNLSETCEPSRPVPVIAFHGDADPIVPYHGGDSPGGALPDILIWSAGWAARNGCDSAMDITADDDSARGVYQDCDADVELITIFGGGHTWSGGGEHPPEFIVGTLNMNVDTTAIMWSFFEAHPLSE